MKNVTSLSSVTTQRSRVVGVDIARGLALLGIVWAHLHPPEPLAVYILGNGVAPALFAILSGLSLALTTGAITPFTGEKLKNAKKAAAIRGAFIVLLGLTLGLASNSIYIILVHFGVLFLITIPFLSARPRTLFGIALSFMILAPIASHFIRAALPSSTIRNPSFRDFLSPFDLLSTLFLTGAYPIVFWIAYFLLGLAVGRVDFNRPKYALFLGVGGAVAAAVSYALSKSLLSSGAMRSAIAESYPEGTPWSAITNSIAHGLQGVTPRDGSIAWLAIISPHSGTTFDLISTAALALLVLSLCLLLVEGLQAISWGRDILEFLRIFFGAGTMTLTLYSLHVLMNTPLLPPGEDIARIDVHYTVILSIGIVFALFNLKGPLELLSSQTVRALSR